MNPKENHSDGMNPIREAPVTSERKSERNYGADLLKIVSMWMIPVLHVLGHGGILELAQPFTFRGGAAWLLEAAAFCAVNNYALISGYVGYGKRFRPSRLIYLYLQVLFYRLLITALFLLFRPEAVTAEQVLNALIPVRFGHWYFTAYFSLFFFIPFLNRVIQSFEKKACEWLMLALFFVLSLLPTLLQADTGYSSYGYSALWLGALYLGGAYLKKYDIPSRVTGKTALLLYVSGTGVTWLTGLAVGHVNYLRLGYPLGQNLLLQYISPTVLLCAVGLLLFFARLKVAGRWVTFIRFFAPLSFAVYLIHTEPLIWNNLFYRAFAGLIALPSYLLIPAVLGTAFTIWLGCSLIDRLRLALFDLCHVGELSERLERMIEAVLKKCLPSLWAAE